MHLCIRTDIKFSKQRIFSAKPKLNEIAQNFKDADERLSTPRENGSAGAVAGLVVILAVVVAALLATLDDDKRHVDQLLRGSAAAQHLLQVEDLAPQNVHLLLEQATLKVFVGSVEILEAVAKAFDETGRLELRQNLGPDPGGEWDLGVRKTGPDVRIGPPLVRMLERERQAVVDGKNLDFRLLAVWLLDPHQPVFGGSVGVPDDVVEDDDPLKLILEKGRGLFAHRLLLQPLEESRSLNGVLDENLERPNLKRKKTALISGLNGVGGH